MENSKPSLTDLLISMRERPKPINPPLLYHYTHRTALSGILSSKSIWATDARQLEDPSEIRYGFEIAQEILSDELTSADKSGQKSMHACLEIGLSEMNLVSDCSSDAYVACFCANPHSDFHYRKFGAYRIEFYLLLTRLAGHRLAPLRSELPSACRNRLMVVEAVHKLMAL